jgi:predicted enzyme related to lactoylglutathione lyase
MKEINTSLANLFKDIEKNGGKKASEVLPEGDKGLFQYFEDSEGNNFAIYTYKYATGIFPS